MANMLISKYLSPQSSKNQMKPVSLSQCEANATKRRSSFSAEEIEAKRQNAILTRRRKSISSMKPENMKQEANIEYEKPKIMKTDVKPEIKPDSSISEETLKPAAENEAIYTAAEISLSSSDIARSQELPVFNSVKN